MTSSRCLDNDGSNTYAHRASEGFFAAATKCSWPAAAGCRNYVWVHAC